MSKFKAGDRILCVDDDACGSNKLEYGRVYEVDKRRQGFPLERVYLVGFPHGGFLESRFELVQEEQVKFKVGDKVRCIRPVHTMEQYRNREGRITSIADGGLNVMNIEGFDTSVTPEQFELVESKDELQQRIDDANKGWAALHKLYECKDELDVTSSAGEVIKRNGASPTVGDIFYHIGKSNPSWTISIKPKKPKFESYTINSTGWKVALSLDDVHVGCMKFDLKVLKAALRALLKDNDRDDVVTRLDLRSSRSGIKHREHTLPWADAEILLEKLEKVGI